MVSNPMAPAAASAKRQPLGLDVLRVVIRHHHVEQAKGQRLDQRDAILLGAQRGDILKKVR